MPPMICQKQQFLIPNNLYHLSGHSLGPLTRQAFHLTQEALNQWKGEGVNAWESTDWMQLPVTVAEKIARLLGATSNEVIVTDSTTINLYKVLISALRLNPERNILLTEKENFSTDLYIAQGITPLFPKITLQCVESHQLKDALSEKVAVLFLSHVNYRNSNLHALSTLTHLAQQQGIIVVWDLSHSVGMIPLSLSVDNVDFAVGCTYKYLNGGPGAPSFIYVNKKYHHQIKNPIQGWMAHHSPFDFANHFSAKKNANAFLAGTPPILSMKALDGALSVFAAIDMHTLRERSLHFSAFFIEFVQNNVPQLKCLAPTNPQQRGGHLAFVHPEARTFSQRLIQQGILCDYRSPNLIRISLCPLYLTFDDLKVILSLLQEIFACNH